MSKTDQGVKRNPLITPPRETTVVLHPGDVEARLDELDEKIERALAEERPTSARRMAGGGGEQDEANRLAAEKDRVVAEARDESVTVRLRGISPRRYDRLLDDHQPRKGKAMDARVGYDRDAFPAALVRACLVDPVVTEEEFAEWVESVSSGRFDRIFAAAYEVTTGDVDLPKSSAVSVVTRVRQQSSRQPNSTG